MCPRKYEKNNINIINCLYLNMELSNIFFREKFWPHASPLPLTLQSKQLSFSRQNSLAWLERAESS
jgi:hypothetical protein